MTSVSRLKSLLEDLENRSDKKVLNTWYEIFSITTIFEVYDHLSHVGKEIDSLEEELIKNKLIDNPDYKNIISSFNGIVQHIHMTQTISQISFMNKENIMKLKISLNSLETLNNAGHLRFKFESDVKEEEFDNFKNSINETIEKIENSDMPDEDKKIFLSIFYDFNKAISLYKINGLNSFWEVIENNICKIKLIDEIENSQENGNYNELKRVLINSLNEVWYWIQIYQKADQTLKVSSKIYGYIKSKVSELTDNIEDVEISE